MKILTVLSMALFLTSCGVRSIPMALNDVDAKWAEISNQYERRADLIPNLVATVKGYASHEKETFEAVINARSKATQITVDPKNLNPEKLKQFQQAQGELSQALGRLMMVSERYPDLKASANFMALQSQLEGTENRISIAKRRYIESVQNFNNLVSVFPSNITNRFMFGYTKKPQFSIDKNKKALPQVGF